MNLFKKIIDSIIIININNTFTSTTLINSVSHGFTCMYNAVEQMVVDFVCQVRLKLTTPA